MRVFFLCALSCLLFSCSQKNNRLGESLFPQMNQVDSIQVLYYDKEDIDRFYTYLPTTDSSSIHSFVEDVMRDTIPATPCSRQGKVYCFVKGNIYNTLYFNVDCPIPHFRMIKNAKLYTFSMSEASKQQLIELKKKSISL